MPKAIFPANVPEKLIELFHQEVDNFNALARRLDVTPALVWKLLIKGIEPKDKTLRKKIFLPEKASKPKPAWLRQATNNLAELENKTQPLQKRVYNRKGERIR